MSESDTPQTTRKTPPPGYKTQSEDTSYDAEQFLFAAYRHMPPWEKIRHIVEDARYSDELARLSLLRKFPDADEQELRLRSGERRFDRQTMIRVFGWDPAVGERPRG